MVKYTHIAGSANGRHPRSERGNLGPNPSPAAQNKECLAFQLQRSKCP